MFYVSAFCTRGADLQRWGGPCFSPPVDGLLPSALVSRSNSAVETVTFSFYLLFYFHA